NTVLLVASSLIPFFTGYNGFIYLAAAVSVGAYFIFWNIMLFRNPSKDLAWKNFKISMMYLGVLFTAVIADVALKPLGF
ncbi:MAG: protoheme IX farnesyltransferase, partial [Deltaproteobacteria bacterium]|nr:protoheme IX farnesyltransferase [Deltaproteobacteria bacterium]